MELRGLFVKTLPRLRNCHLKCRDTAAPGYFFTAPAPPPPFFQPVPQLPPSPGGGCLEGSVPGPARVSVFALVLAAWSALGTGGPRVLLLGEALPPFLPPRTRRQTQAHTPPCLHGQPQLPSQSTQSKGDASLLSLLTES